MTTSAFLGNGATPHLLVHEGRTYRFRRLDQDAMEAISAWAIRRARRAAIVLYEHDPADLSRRLRELEKDVMDGAFEFYEDLLTGAKDETTGETRGGLLFTKAGTLAMLSILCGCNETELVALMVARRDEVMHLLRLILAESVPGFGKEPDPNAPPAQTAVSA